MKKWGKVFVAMGLAVALLCGCGGGQESGEKDNSGEEAVKVEKTVAGKGYFGATVEDFDQMVEGISDKVPLESRKADQLEGVDLMAIVYHFTPVKEGADLRMIVIVNPDDKVIEVGMYADLDKEKEVSSDFPVLVREIVSKLEPGTDLDRFEANYKLTGDIGEKTEGKEGNLKVFREDDRDGTKMIWFKPA